MYPCICSWGCFFLIHLSIWFVVLAHGTFVCIVTMTPSREFSYWKYHHNYLTIYLTALIRKAHVWIVLRCNYAQQMSPDQSTQKLNIYIFFTNILNQHLHIFPTVWDSRFIQCVSCGRQRGENWGMFFMTDVVNSDDLISTRIRL